MFRQSVMASNRRNLPSFQELSEKVALLESIRSSPTAAPAHYANLLEDIFMVFKRWASLAPAIAANWEATDRLTSRLSGRIVTSSGGYLSHEWLQ